MKSYKLHPLLLLLLLAIPTHNSYAIRGDYTGDGKADLSIATVNRVAKTTTWKVRDLRTASTSTYTLAAPGDALVPGDYNGDGITDPAVVYVAADARLEWHILINGNEETHYFGQNGDTPLTGDVDCDGISDRIVARKGSDDRYYWYFELSTNQSIAPVKYGRAGDQLFLADVSAGGCDELVLARPSGTQYTWYKRTLTNGTYTQLNWGLVTDTLLAPADIDGNGTADFIYVRSSGATQTALARLTDSTSQSFNVGSISNVVLTGHFSGNSAAEVGTYRQGSGSGASRFTLQLPSDTSVVDFGNQSSILIRPDGTVVQPGSVISNKCGTTVSIDSLTHVLYKPSNLHGGRGPTFLVQNPAERTNKRKILIKDVNCKTISSFGLYRTDYPFGSRYYEGSGGSNHSSNQLQRLAKRAGSTAILVEGLNKWIRVDNPQNRQGNIQK